MESAGQTRVAIVGSGMAGLVTAYLLSHDVQRRYAVTVFEKGDCLSLDSASVSLRDQGTGKVERVDMPMRSIAGGYYQNTCAMYDFLGIRYRAQKFLFAFSEHRLGQPLATPYFIHASNLHQLPPRPSGTGLLQHVLTTIFVLACYAWLSICCFVIPPGPDETVRQYASKIWLPSYFLSHYALPLMASVATCSHDQFLDFPASDMTEYKRLSHGQHHYVVSHGVRTVQRKLIENLETRMSSQVVNVARSAGSRVKVQWRSAKWVEGKENPIEEEEFDRVVLALSPDVIGAIYEPLRDAAARIPTIQVESAVLQRQLAGPGLSVATEDEDEMEGKEAVIEGGGDGSSEYPQLMTLNSTYEKDQDARTEALHLVDCGAVVATIPFSVEKDAAIHKTAFPRVLRSVESRKVVNGLLRKESKPRGGGDKTGAQWSNGCDNVWLAGGWCWDGMVLLEGCVVSAMRVANDFGVKVPWGSDVKAI